MVNAAHAPGPPAPRMKAKASPTPRPTPRAQDSVGPPLTRPPALSRRPSRALPLCHAAPHAPSCSCRAASHAASPRNHPTLTPAPRHCSPPAFPHPALLSFPHPPPLSFPQVVSGNPVLLFPTPQSSSSYRKQNSRILPPPTPHPPPSPSRGEGAGPPSHSVTPPLPCPPHGTTPASRPPLVILSPDNKHRAGIPAPHPSVIPAGSKRESSPPLPHAPVLIIIP